MSKPTWLRVIAWLFAAGLCCEALLWGIVFTTALTASSQNTDAAGSAAILGFLGIYPVGFLFLLWLVTTIVYKFQVNSARLQETAIAEGLRRAGPIAPASNARIVPNAAGPWCAECKLVPAVATCTAHNINLCGACIVAHNEVGGCTYVAVAQVASLSEARCLCQPDLAHFDTLIWPTLSC